VLPFFSPSDCLSINIKGELTSGERERETKCSNYDYYYYYYSLILSKVFEREQVKKRTIFSNILVCLSLTYNKYVTNIFSHFFFLFLSLCSIHLSIFLQHFEWEKKREGGASLFVELIQMWSHIRYYLVYKQHDT